MRLSFPFPIRLPARLRWGLTIVSVLLATVALVTWTLSFLGRETARLKEPVSQGIEIPALDRALLSEFAVRVPP